MSALLTSIAVTALLLGTGLFTFALRGRRTGGKPRCARCCYDLSSFIPDVCPECGAPMGPGSILTHRHRRPRLALAGALVAVVAMGTLYAHCATLTAQPAVVLAVTALANAERPGTLRELADRIESGDCPDYVLRLLLPRAFREQARSELVQEGWTRFVAEAFKAGRLTTAESRAFMTNAIPSFTVELRAEGSPPYWALDFAQINDQATPRFTWNGLDCSITAQVLVGGVPAGPWVPLDFSNTASARWTCGGDWGGTGGWMILGLRDTQPPAGSKVTLCLRTTLTDRWNKSASPMQVTRTEEHVVVIPGSFPEAAKK